MKSPRYYFNGFGLTPLVIAIFYSALGLFWLFAIDKFILGHAEELEAESIFDSFFILVTALVLFIILEIKDRGKERLHTQLRTVLRRIMTLKEMHSEIIANQLQNELNQELAAIKMQLVTLKTKFKKNPGDFEPYLNSETDSISQEISSLIQKFRRFTEELRPEVLEDLDLKDSIEWLINDHSIKSGIKTVFQSKIDEFSLEKGTSVNIFRILQEAVICLDDPSEIIIKASASRKKFVFSITFFNDKKEVFPISQNEIKLLSLRERIAMVEGDIDEIISERGLFRISFFVPRVKK